MSSVVIWTISGIILAIVGLLYIGMHLSETITDVEILVIFWLLYFISIATIISIGIAAYFYISINNKKGPPGPPGEIGDSGNSGDDGECPTDCESKICYNTVLAAVIDQINIEAGDPNPPVKLNNIYIKDKIKLICYSTEYNELVPYRGPTALITHLVNTWQTWVSIIYKAGGRTYFETIGAENEWKWVSANPFNEIKKYDIFYWGMPAAYRPVKTTKCKTTHTGQTYSGNTTGSKAGDSSEPRGFVGPAVIDSKYSIQTFLNMIPEGHLIHQLTGTKFYIKAVDGAAPNIYHLQQLDKATGKYDLCLAINKGKFNDIQCNAIDETQNWKIIFTGNADHEVRVISADDSNKILSINVNKLDAGGQSILLTLANITNESTIFVMSA